MSTRPPGPDGSQAPPPQPAARGRSVIAAVVAVLAVIGIIIYAWLRSRTAVPGAAVAPNPEPTLPPMSRVGTKAPPFSLKAPLASITSQAFQGKPYLLEIFATWCPHCQRMTRVLRSLRRTFPPERLGMLSVTGSPYARTSTPDNLVTENQQDVTNFERDFNTTWPSMYDPNLSVAKTWGLDGFPTIYVVNAKGTIVYAASGEIQEPVLAAAIRKAGG